MDVNISLQFTIYMEFDDEFRKIEYIKSQQFETYMYICHI